MWKVMPCFCSNLFKNVKLVIVVLTVLFLYQRQNGSFVAVFNVEDFKGEQCIIYLLKSV